MPQVTKKEVKNEIASIDDVFSYAEKLHEMGMMERRRIKGLVTKQTQDRALRLLRNTICSVISTVPVTFQAPVILIPDLLIGNLA